VEELGLPTSPACPVHRALTSTIASEAIEGTAPEIYPTLASETSTTKENLPSSFDSLGTTHDFQFLELFAGEGTLTEAVKELGLPAEADDAAAGGVDFLDAEQVQKLKEKVQKIAGQVNTLVIHLAPPCATFSRARDRATRTKLRSNKNPEGLPSKQAQTSAANRIAAAAYNFAVWAANDLGALVSVENPATSYLWRFVDLLPQADVLFSDIDLSACMFHAPYQKHTRLRCWNWAPTKLNKVCRLNGTVFTCGRSQSEGWLNGW
jgi:hypothetical protein